MNRSGQLQPDQNNALDEATSMEIAGDVWLCFSGGNALGAYHSGGYEALANAGIEPTAVAGASIGAVVGAIIAGNAPENRITNLKRFWSVAEQWSLLPEDKSSRIASGIETLMTGRPGLFYPRAVFSLFGTTRPNLFEPSPMRSELRDLIDFGILNSGKMRYLATAVNVEDGQVEVFDTHAQTLAVDHIMASCAFPVFFPPVLIDGKAFVDAGTVCNLPIEALFREIPGSPVTCLVLDAANPDGPIPKGIDAALARAQDILFSSQSRSAIARVERLLKDHRDLAEKEPLLPIKIFYCPYKDEADKETGLKMIDFRRTSLAQRWNEGQMAVSELISCIQLQTNDGKD